VGRQFASDDRSAEVCRQNVLAFIDVPNLVIESVSHANDLIVLMPVYNDWKALSSLLPRLDQELNANRLSATVVLVDDGSTVAIPNDLCPNGFQCIESIDVLSLRRNLGHQRAIAVGLSYIEANMACQYVIVMDADGEDDPRDVPRLVRECIANQGMKIIFAARTRRSEGLFFKFFYHSYRFIHFLLTGVKVRVGNFSVVPMASLKRLVAVSELWNHYAAAVHKARLPMEVIPTKRSSRLAGPSHMDIVALVVHGLSAMAVFGDRIGVRLLLLVSLGILVNVGALVGVIVIRLFTTLAIPGWATYAVGLLFIMLIQMLLVVLVFIFVILASRDRTNVIPSRDYVHIAGKIHRVYGKIP
jgi:glycosyltransferase involved in cell wall biosynthesis